MKKILLLLSIVSILGLPALCSQYGLHSPQNFTNNFDTEAGERILFILDLSNSMTENLEGSTKFNLMLDTMQKSCQKSILKHGLV